MVYSLTYRRPTHVSSSASTASSHGSTTLVTLGSKSLVTSKGIPEALSFERVISGGTCPPCTTRDFMNYLIYIEHAAENLQFYLWLIDYTKRFEKLPEREKALSLPAAINNDKTTPRGPPCKSKMIVQDAETLLDGTKFATVSVCEKPNGDSDSISQIESPSESDWNDDATTLHSSVRVNYERAASNAYQSAGVKFQPFTILPFREEVMRIIATYIADGAPRQLNLASKERVELLQALATTTHPSAFQNVNRTVEWSLRRQAHPNFIRWSICNGNKPRTIFARGLGIGSILSGLVLALLLTLSRNGRVWRILAAMPLLIGVATLFAAWKGMCVVLHGMHHRHLRPWELFSDDHETANSTNDLHEYNMNSLFKGNSYEDEPWVAKYEKRNLLRKIFDREVWIEEPALRQIQDTIFLQAMLCGVVVTIIVTGAFCAIPVGQVI